MRSDLLALEAELDEIEKLISSQQEAEGFYADIVANGGAHSYDARTIASDRTVRRKYQYISGVIALYGAMEQYVEAILSSYLRALPKVFGRFENIPESVRAKHHELTVDYLTAIKANRVHNPEDQDAVVLRLARCRPRATRYEFNTRAFTLRNANMSFDRMRGMFAGAGISITPRVLVNSRSFGNYYAAKNGLVLPQIGDAEARAEFSAVDDLVDRRNRVAHGSNCVDDIEDAVLLKDRVNHLRMYGRAIHEVVEGCIMRCCYQRRAGLVLGVPVHKFRDNVVCFELKNGEIATGDAVYMIPTDDTSPVQRGSISTLEVDRVRHERLVGADGLTMAASVTFVVSPTSNYGLLPPDMVALLDA